MYGVREVTIQPGPGDHGRLTVDCRVDPRDGVEAAIARAVAGRWDLHHLQRHQPTLENVFLRYVSEPAAPGSAP